MEITILDNQLQKVAIVDDYVSLIWSKRYYDIGALDLEIEASTKNLSIFRKGYYITRKDDDAIYVIKALEIDTKENNDNSLIVGAYDCKEILQRRIIWKTVVFSGTVENYIRKLITDNVINPSATNRKINNFQLKAAKGYTERIDQQVTYNNLADKITEICTTFGYGWKVTLENGVFYFDLYKGVDHSTDQQENIKLIFSPDNENIISTKYKTDDSNFKNVALVGGEGEGTDRKLRTIGSAAGINRYETFIDASGLSTNTEEGDLVDYYNALIAEGKEKLSEQAVVTSFEGEVDTNSYKYKTDYNLGDIVTVKNEYGIMAHARITEVIETWDDEGYTVEPKFEYFEPIDFEVPVEGALLTENRMMLMSEVGNMPLEVEESESHTGVKISELDELLAVDDGCCLPVVHGTGTRKVRLGTIFDKIRSWLGNGTLTIKRNGVLVNTFAANQSSNAEVNIEVPNYVDGVKDYNSPDGATIRIGYEGTALTKDNLAHVAGYALDGDNKYVLKDINDNALSQFLGLRTDYSRGVLHTFTGQGDTWTCTEDVFFYDFTISQGDYIENYRTYVNNNLVTIQDNITISSIGIRVNVYMACGYAKKGDVIKGSGRLKVYGLK